MSRQDAEHAEHFVEKCKRELQLYPRRPIAGWRNAGSALIEQSVAKEIDMSGIFKMTPEQIDEALQRVAA